jgi:TPR repeat protein
MTLAKLMSLTPFFPSLWRAYVGSGQIGRASHAYENLDYSESFRIYKEIADSNAKGAKLHEKAVIATAQYFVGYMFFQGEGVPKDISQSQIYFQKAANLGHADAIEYLKQYR